jgi:hypothetical protein
MLARSLDHILIRVHLNKIIFTVWIENGPVLKYGPGIELAFTITVTVTYSVTHQYLKKLSYGFWDNQWFWSEPNISQIEACSSTIYACYQEFDFDFFFEFQ